MMSHIAILLVEPENPDNIGAVARAMKNMGLKDLCLVKPVKPWKTKGRKMAVKAFDLLEQASVFNSVEDAVREAHLVIGTTRRGGPRRGLFIPFDEAIAKIKKADTGQRVVIMFGKESKGLDNPSLNRCDWVTTIPVHPDLPSINLAQAVMIFAFTLWDRSLPLPKQLPKRGQFRADQGKKSTRHEARYVPKEEIQAVLDSFEKAVGVLGFDNKSRVVSRIRASLGRLFKRSALLESEAQMFKGLSRRICEKLEDKCGVVPESQNR